MADRKIPKSIKPCPIKSAGLEIRFLTNQSKEEIHQKLFSLLQGEVTDIRPVSIQRNREINSLEIENRVSFVCGDISVGFGSNSLLFESVGEYPGWDTFFKFVKMVLDGLNESLNIKEISRLGLRYINFFDSTKNLNSIAEFELKIPSLGTNLSKYLCKSELTTDNGSVIISLAEEIKFQLNNSIETGSVVDIDVVTNSGMSQIFDNLLIEQIAKMHELESQIFFNILTDEFYNSLDKVFE